jgi:hypothetical protein
VLRKRPVDEEQEGEKNNNYVEEVRNGLASWPGHDTTYTYNAAGRMIRIVTVASESEEEIEIDNEEEVRYVK